MNNNPETNTPAADQQQSQQQERTFTQSELDKIVQSRLAEERKKSEKPFADREKALQDRESLLVARETISKAGLPSELIDALDKSSPEALQKAIDVIKPMLSGKGKDDNPPFAPYFTRQMNNTPPKVDPMRGAFGLKERKS